jgi:hypothetical protein
MGCGNDDDDTGPSATATLNYDGDNVTAPQLPPGRNRFAAYFPPVETAPFVGRSLEGVTFYMSDIPLSTRVTVYQVAPGILDPGATPVYTRDITNRVTTIGWTEDRIIPAIPIEADRAIWLVVEVELDNGEPFSVGCDAGRNYTSDGDLLSLSTNPSWQSFGTINPGETVNWNIRGIISAN